MRIVHVTDAYLPKRGGIEVQVSELARRQAEAGHDVSVVTRAPGPPTPDAMRVDRAGGGLAPWQWAPAARRVATLVEAAHAEVVHCHLSVVSPAAVVALRAASRIGVPAVATYHSVLPREPHHWLPLRRLPFDAAAIDWTAVSRVAAASVERLLGPDLEVNVLPNGLDLAAWRAASTVPSAPRMTDEVVLAWVGRVTGRKRPFAALRILAQAQADLDRGTSGTRLRLDVVGDGPWSRVARGEARRLGVASQVRWCGSVDHLGVAKVLAGADAFLATATAESFGIAAMEARACGLPVLARTGTGLAELIQDGVSGLLAADDDGLATAVVRMTAPRLRRTITEHNVAVAAPAGWAESLHQADLAYQRAGGLVRNRRRAGPSRSVAGGPLSRTFGSTPSQAAALASRT